MLIVQKFGGSSVADLQRIRNVARIIADTKKQGHDVVVVVSAMYGETDRLIALTQAFPRSDEREYDALVATGEQVAAALVSMALQTLQCAAHSYTAAQLGIITTSRHKKARIVDIDLQVLHTAINNGHVPVVAGFQGIDARGYTTTLGRGGSDVTAVALAAVLQADECQIYTDVDGVYTTDPKVVPAARRLERITHSEMLEMASLGAQVLQNRCLEFAGKYRVPVRVLSSLCKGNGTLITFANESVEQALVAGIAFERQQAKLTLQGIPERPGLASYILAAIAEANIDVDMIVQNIPTSDTRIDFSFTLHRDDYLAAHSIMQYMSDELSARSILGSDDVAKISLVGVGMRSHAGVASNMLSALGREGIQIHLITASEIKISAVIDEKYLELGARALHRYFGLDQSTSNA